VSQNAAFVRPQEANAALAGAGQRNAPEPAMETTVAMKAGTPNPRVEPIARPPSVKQVGKMTALRQAFLPTREQPLDEQPDDVKVGRC
jgi:hypothetical protein